MCEEDIQKEELEEAPVVEEEPKEETPEEKETRELQERIVLDMDEINKRTKAFAEELIEEGYLTQSLELASESLKRKIDTIIFQTKLFAESQQLRKKCYESPLKDLELVSEE